MFMPASINWAIISGDSVAGPRVAIIFVWRIVCRIGCHHREAPWNEQELFGFVGRSRGGYNCERKRPTKWSQHFANQLRLLKSPALNRRDLLLSSSKVLMSSAANPRSSTLRLASSLISNERSSKLTDPTEAKTSSTIIILQ